MKKIKNKINKIVLAMAGIAVLMVANMLMPGPSESWLRDRVVMLKSAKGSCSGEQVRAPSGVDYILTAGHCRALEEDGSIEVYKEDGSHLPRRIIKEDPSSDLLLLEGLPNLRGMDIAHGVNNEEHVRTLTHGAGFKTYKTEGTIVQNEHVQILAAIILTAEDEAACTGEKYSVIDLIIVKACLLDVEETVTTAMIVPGSSGGAVIDDSGRLMGVVSAGGGGFGLLVTIDDIRSFLRPF